MIAEMRDRYPFTGTDRYFRSLFHGSLMGLGMTLRKADYDRAFCDHIEFNNEHCSTWSARNK